MKKAVELKNISFSYQNQNHIINDLSLDLFSGEFTALTGSNGSGKTTLGKIIMGILKPQKGEITLIGEDAFKMTLGQKGQTIGYLFQNPNSQLFATTVYEELSFVMEMKGHQKSYIDEKVNEMLERFQLEHLKDSFPLVLSGGEKQRLALASVLMNQPQYLILDEPTTSLDMKRKGMFSRWIQVLKEENIGMLVISHDESFVKNHADRVLQLEGGRIIYDSKLKT